jgi:hypothetical protein
MDQATTDRKGWGYSKTIVGLVDKLIAADYTIEVWCDYELVDLDHVECRRNDWIYEDIDAVDCCDLVVERDGTHVGTIMLVNDGCEEEFVSDYTYNREVTGRPYDLIMESM